MIIVSTPIAIRPADNIAQMLRELADEIESNTDVVNVLLVIEREDDEVIDVRGYGPCDDPYRAAGIFTRAARDVLP